MKCIGILLNNKKVEELDISNYSNIENYSILSDMKGNIFWINPLNPDEREVLLESVTAYIMQSSGLYYILNMISDDDEVTINHIYDTMYEMHNKYFDFIKNNPKTKYISHEINQEDLYFTISLGSDDPKISDYAFTIRVKSVIISNINSSDVDYDVEYNLSFIGITNDDIMHRLSYPDNTYIKLRLFKDGTIKCISNIKELIYLVLYGD